MNGLDFLDLVIGLIFIYLIYSIACSTIWEIIVNLTHLRGHMLRNWILKNFNELADNEKLGVKIINHPIIKGMSKNVDESPTYIASGLFTEVLIDLVVQGDLKDSKSFGSPANINTLRNSLENTALLDPGIRRVFLQYIADASGSFEQVKDKISKWFDQAQERLMGSYKRNLQLWIFVISIFMVGFTNADTIKLASYLYNNADARKALADKAVFFVQDSTNLSKISKNDKLAIDSAMLREQKANIAIAEKNLNTLKELNKELNESAIPIGWGIEKLNSHDPLEILKKIAGLLLTAFAVSMGAPFWFDILSKLANLRAAGTKPKSSLEEIAPKT